MDDATVAELGAAEAQLLPKMSPTMEVGPASPGPVGPALGPAEENPGAGWWVHEGLLGCCGAHEEAEEEEEEGFGF